MYNYSYTQVIGGYRWNMVQRILQEVGLMPASTCDMGDKTVISFSRTLTEVEKTKLDILMANTPTQPPVAAGTVFKVKDLWERLQEFNTVCGVTFRLYYSESVPGSGIVDTIELHAPTVLTNTQKNKVKTEFTNIIS